VFGISFYYSYYRLTKKTTDKLTHAGEWKFSFWLELLHPFRFIRYDSNGVRTKYDKHRHSVAWKYTRARVDPLY